MGFQEYGESRSFWDHVQFFMYAGKYSAGAERCGAEEPVLRLVEEIQKNQNYQFFFDNWFSALHFLSDYNPWVFYQLQQCALTFQLVAHS